MVQAGRALSAGSKDRRVKLRSVSKRRTRAYAGVPRLYWNAARGLAPTAGWCGRRLRLEALSRLIHVQDQSGRPSAPGPTRSAEQLTVRNGGRSSPTLVVPSHRCTGAVSEIERRGLHHFMRANGRGRPPEHEDENVRCWSGACLVGRTRERGRIR